ncbi:hypothetical protein O7631_18230 [Micromonospora sp. WMMD967]|uniref:hypothetical protein n=1 Tax=Micromonospora sp. WMMD967 TaxID=3016101 RepID=UPI0024179CEB|nr:hypothetical protein [Micromonospora sp. WMMD967]MDG4838457.1 hypothetical protein [Micromonospora sp. WMMD967]
MTEQLKATSIRTIIGEGQRLISVVIVLTVPYLLGQIVGFALTARTFPPGLSLWFMYATFGLFTTMLSITLGWTLGRIFGSIFAALVAALSWLLLVGLLSNWGDFVVISGRPEVILDSKALILRLALVVALLVALATIPSTVEPSMRTLLVPGSVALVLAATMFGTSVVTQRTVPEKVSCTSGQMALCIWPEHEKYLSQLAEVQRRAEVLPAAFSPPTRVNEYGLDPIQIYRSGGRTRIFEDPEAPPSFSVIEGSRWSYSGGIARAILTNSYARYGICDWAAMPEADKARSAAVDAWLETYLAGGGTPDYRTNAPPELHNSWNLGRQVANDNPLSEQFRWAEKEVVYLSRLYCKADS